MNQGKNVYFQGSRQMDNFSRRYYERELGAGIAPSPSMREHFGYTEPFRRFVQRENFSPQANPLRNEMPSWLPGADYLTNFHVGDPYTKVDEGYARLPGAGYEALHPELKGLTPDEYPDINKLAILADVAPYSREYNIFRSKVGADSRTTPSCGSSTRRSSTASGRQGSPSSGWITRSFRPAATKTPHAPAREETRPRSLHLGSRSSLAVLEPRSEYAPQVRCHIFSVPLAAPSMHLFCPL